MIRIAMIAAAAMTWACAAQPRDTGASSQAATEADRCGLSHWGQLIGQPESAIPRDQLPQGARVICASCMVTQDFRPDRLNIILTEDGRVASMRCG